MHLLSGLFVYQFMILRIFITSIISDFKIDDQKLKG